jgi:ribosomal protein S27AE
MKKIETRYADKMVDGKFYSKFKITSSEEINSEMDSKMEEPGYIYVPYMCQEHTEESSKAYDDFMNIYEEEHKLCPNCGDDGSYSMTLMGYILNMDKKEEYKDLNRCQCQKCGNSHTFHERVKE